MASLHVLLLEDNPADYRLLQEELRQAGTVELKLTRAEGLAEALACLEKGRFDAILTDLSVPDSFGIATVEALLSRAAETPVVVLTGSEDDRTGLAAVQLGAQDYLVKGETGGEQLLRSLLYAIERKHSELALRQDKDEMADRAKRQLGRYNDALQMETLERYRIEAALRESERRFRSTFEQTAVGMAHIAMDGRFLRVNRKLCDQLGYQEGELLTLALQDVCDSGEAGAEEEAQRKRLLNGAVRDYALERRCRRRDGSPVALRQTLSLFRSDQGEPRYFIAVFESQGGSPAGGEGLEVELAEVRRELAAVNGELDALSYSVSHDLRAPLRAVGGFSRILVRDYGEALPPEARQYLDMVADGAIRLDRLIQDILAYSRLGRQELNLQEVDLEGLARECVHQLRPEFEGRKVEFSLGELPPWTVDRTLMKELLMALLGNAVKFSAGRDPARIEVGARVEKGELHVQVRDNGIGFDMNYAHKLFGVFQRLHGAGEFCGTGIGLAIAQRIVQRHRGRIWAESAPDQGAVFHFSLPPAVPAH